MPEEGFLRRWARVKASGAEEASEARQPAAPAEPVTCAGSGEAGGAVRPVVQPGEAAPPLERTAPTIEDAARLTPQSDFSAFVGRDVDQDVRRLAMKKLFADPHFKVLDRLDMYMDDYNKPDPVSATMLAALSHARGVLRRPEEVQAELARLAARDAQGDVAADVVADVTADPAPPLVVCGAAEAEDGPGRAVLVEATCAHDAGKSAPEAALADARVHFVPAAENPVDVVPAPVLPPRAIEPADDTIALHSPRAQNAEARL